MENKDKNTFKITLDSNLQYDNGLRLIKLKSSNDLRLYNSEKFSNILGNKIIFISGLTGRVNAKFNPHIANELIENNCNNWRIDYWKSCMEREFYFNIDIRAEYNVNFETGSITRKLNKNERVCKHCKSIVDKNDIIGAFCEKCLTKDNGLAYRYSYHGYKGNYNIQDKKINQKKVAVFGTEIERDYLGSQWDDNFYLNLNRALIESVKLIYGDKLKNKKVNRKAVFMTDSSLTKDGIEWITFPQSYERYKQEKDKLDEIIEVMQKYNFGNSVKAGNHIHINRKFFGDIDKEQNEKSKYAAAKMALLLNEYWEEFIAISGRSNLDYARKPAQCKKDKIFSLVEKTIQNQYEHGVAVNLQHDDTVEIRIWGGINNASDLILFLDITQALAIFVKKKSLEKCQRARFIDILEFLTDKEEHLKEIKKRLNDRDITSHDKDIESLLNSEVK